MVYIGDELKNFRERRGLTQEEFAEEINVSRPYLAKLESTSLRTMKPLTHQLLKEICKKFNDYSLYDIWEEALIQWIKKEREINSIRKIC